MSSSKAIGRTNYDGIQALRFVAAFLVLVAHVSLAVVERMGAPIEVWGKGAIGVRIFFVISGFVMVIASAGLDHNVAGAKEFASRRFVRIFPLYWLVTTLKLIAVLAIPALAIHSSFDWYHTITSYLLIPARNIEGDIRPLHAVGWTLIHEVYFYALFALGLALRISPIAFSAVIICVGAVVSYFVDMDSGTAFVAYLNPINLLFVAGMFIAVAVQKGWYRHIPVFVSTAMIVLGSLLIAAATPDVPWLSYLGNSGPAAILVVAGTVFLERSVGDIQVPSWLRALGDSSYSLYLIHPLVVPVLAIVLKKFGISSYEIAFLLILVAAVLIGEIFSRVIENPMTRYLRKRIA